MRNYVVSVLRGEFNHRLGDSIIRMVQASQQERNELAEELMRGRDETPSEIEQDEGERTLRAVKLTFGSSMPMMASRIARPMVLISLPTFSKKSTLSSSSTILIALRIVVSFKLIISIILSRGFMPLFTIYHKIRNWRRWAPERRTRTTGYRSEHVDNRLAEIFQLKEF